jgi:hypothetical protein
MKQFRPGRAFTAASLVLLVLCMAGCGKSIYGWQVRTNSTPVAPSFDRAPIDQMRVAILPTLATGLHQGTAAGMSQYLDQTLKTLTPTWTVVTEQEALTKINTHGLGVDYVRMRSDAEQSHLLIRQPLAKIGAALGVRYIFQPRLASFTQTMTERWKFPGLDLRLVETRSSLLRVSLQLWEAESGELIWSSVAETIMENEALTQDPVFLEDAVRLTFGSLVSDFLNRRTASKYTPLNEVLNTLVQTAIPVEQTNKNSDETAREKK